MAIQSPLILDDLPHKSNIFNPCKLDVPATFEVIDSWPGRPGSGSRCIALVGQVALHEYPINFQALVCRSVDHHQNNVPAMGQFIGYQNTWMVHNY